MFAYFNIELIQVPSFCHFVFHSFDSIWLVVFIDFKTLIFNIFTQINVHIHFLKNKKSPKSLHKILNFRQCHDLFLSLSPSTFAWKFAHCFDCWLMIFFLSFVPISFSFRRAFFFFFILLSHSDVFN